MFKKWCKTFITNALLLSFSLQAVSAPSVKQEKLLATLMYESNTHLPAHELRNLSQQFHAIPTEDFKKLIEREAMFSEEALSESWAWILENNSFKFSESKLKKPYLAYYSELLFNMRLAQNGYLQISHERTEKLNESLINLVEALDGDKSIAEDKKAEAFKLLVMGSMQWSVVQLGELRSAEKFRVNLFVGQLLSDWASDSSGALLKIASRGRLGNWLGSSVLIALTGAMIGIGGFASAWMLTFPSMELAGQIVDWTIRGGSVLLGLNTLYWWFADRSSRAKLVQQSLTNYNNYFDQTLNAKLHFASPQMIDKTSAKINHQLDAALLSNPAEVVKLLKDSEPKWSGVESLFKGLQDSELEKEVDTLIANDEALEKAARSGREFREFYQRQLQAHFGSQSRIQDPEEAIYKRSLLELKRLQQLHLVELSHYDAEQKAWQETQLKFGLAEDLTYGQLLQRQSDGGIFILAAQFFKKRTIQLLNQEHQRNTPVIDSPELFKSREIYQLNQLRVQNLKGALQLAREIGEHSFEFKKNGQVIKLKLSDLQDSQIDFIGKASEEPASLIRPGGWLKAIANGFFEVLAVRKEFDRTEMREVYKTYLHSPINPTQFVRVRHGDREFILKERDFNELTGHLVPDFENRKDQHAKQHRYILEAQRRDTVLSDLTYFLNSQRDKDLQTLSKRLKASLDQRSFNSHVSRSLTELIRDYGPRNSTNRVEDVRWSGYLFHPFYWTIRDQAADMAGAKPTVIGLQEIVKSESELKEQKENAGYEKSRDKHRHRSFGLKTLRAVVALTAITMFIPGTFYALDTASPYMSGKKEISLPFVNGKQDQPIMSMEGDLSSRINGGGEGDGQKDKDKVFLRFTYVQKGVVVPDYINSTHESNMPQQEFIEEIRADWSNSQILEKISPPPQPEVIAIEAESVAATRVTDSRAPLLVPSGYRIAKLQVWNADRSQTIESKDYGIYKIKRYGTSYIHLTGKYEGPIQYKVGYIKEQPTKAVDSRLQNLDRKIIKGLVTDLRTSGATELAKALDKLVSRTGAISIYDFETAFNESGKYTYQKEKMFNFDFSSPYKDYAKFLRNGEYFYQCTGSNNLLRELLNKYLTQANLPYEAAPLTGFLYQEKDKMQVTAPGHLHTIITHKTLGNEYIELDGTPRNADPRDERAKKEKEKEKEAREQKKPEQEPAKTPGEPVQKGQKYIYMMPARKLEIPEPQLVEVDRKGNQNDRNLPPLDVEYVQNARDNLSILIKDVSKQDKAFADVKIKGKLTGLLILQTLPFMQKMASGEIHPNHLLKVLIMINAGMDLANANNEMNRVADQEFLRSMKLHKNNVTEAIHEQLLQLKNKFAAELTRQQLGVQSQKAGQATYLLNPELQTSLQFLFERLSGAYYGEPKLALRCGTVFIL